MAVAPDGAHIVSGSRDEIIKIWDLASGACLRTLKGHSDFVESVVVSPDGVHIVSGSYDGTIKVWDLASGACVRTLEGHSYWVLTVAVSPDGAHIVSGSYDETIKVWNLASGVCVRTLGHNRPIESVALSPDSRHIVSGSMGSSPLEHGQCAATVKVWDLASGACLRTLAGHSSRVNSVAVSSDGVHIVSGSHDTKIKVWNLSSGACVRTFEGHSEWVLSVAISSDRRSIVSACMDGSIKIWDTRHYRGVPHALIRSWVQGTFATPQADLPLVERQIWHYVYGCKPDNVDDTEYDWPTVLDDLFPLVIAFLVGCREI